MSNIRVLNLNYADPDTIGAFTKSTEQTIAPATNVLAKTRRTKTWRSNGNWIVTSANKAIVFQETSSVNLTANIVTGTYTSDTTFFAAIKTALQAAGASIYTISRASGSSKIKIASDLSSGGNIFSLICTNAGFTAASMLGFSTSADRTSISNYTADTLAIHTNEWLEFDLGTSSNVQAFVMIGLRNEGIQLTSGAVVTLMGNSTDVWTSPQYSQVLTWHEDAISVFDADGLFAGGLRYWRVNIVDPANPDLYVELSAVYLGELFEPDQGAVQFPFETDYIDYSKTEYSETGVAFSNVSQGTQQFLLKWYGLTLTEIEALDDFITSYLTSYPFFISLDPDAVFSSDASKWIKYCRFQSAPKFVLESPNLFSAQWDLRDEL